jgi:cell wall assembly regulator SMI1
MPERHPPGSAGESVAELCDGIAVSAARLLAVIRGSQQRARWSPLITSGGWQWMAQAAAVTSHLSELALRSLADRAGQLPGSPATGTQLDDAADRLVGMRTAWQGVGRMWDAMVTESRLMQTPAMTEASDLVLRLGRLVWDNPRWTPARSGRASRRTPAALAPGPAAVNAVMAAAHQAVDALVHVAITDIETVKAADQAGRLYVSMRSLSGDDKPRPFATAPAARYRAIHDAYRTVLDASIEAARELDVIALATGAPSTALALARAATSVQAHRRIRLDHDNLRDPLPTGSTFFINSRAYTGKVGSLERTMMDRRVSDPVILLRATAIDNAARRLIIEAENTKSESGAPDAHEGRQPSAHGAAELAAQDFPHGPVTGPSAGIRHVGPGSPGAPATAPRTGFRARL